MKKLSPNSHYLAALLTIFVAANILLVSAASALENEGQTTNSGLHFTCKSTPAILKPVKKLLEGRIMAAINHQRFENAKVRVRFKRLAHTEILNEIDPSQIESSLRVTDSNDPLGLSFAVNGGLDLSNVDSCHYSVRVIVSTRAFDNEVGDSVRVQTANTLEFYTPPTGIKNYSN